MHGYFFIIDIVLFWSTVHSYQENLFLHMFLKFLKYLLKMCMHILKVSYINTQHSSWFQDHREPS